MTEVDKKRSERIAPLPPPTTCSTSSSRQIRTLAAASLANSTAYAFHHRPGSATPPARFPATARFSRSRPFASAEAAYSQVERDLATLCSFKLQLCNSRAPSFERTLSSTITSLTSSRFMSSTTYPRGFNPVERNPDKLQPKNPSNPPAISVEELLATIPETALVRAAREDLEPKLPKNVWNHSQRAYL
jgi:hypothetical protein